MSDKIAIFGFKDSMVGQLVHMLNQAGGYSIECFISTIAPPELDIENEHSKRPNKKTEFIENNKIFAKPVHITNSYPILLKELGIRKAFVFEDDKNLRRDLYSKLKLAGVEILTFIHPSTYLGGYNSIGEGTIIFPGCHVGYKSDIGICSIIQPNCMIYHHNVIGNFTDINPNVNTGGFTFIGDFCEINMSVDIINKIRIGNEVRVGAGSLVIDHCEDGHLYFGRPAKKIRLLSD